MDVPQILLNRNHLCPKIINQFRNVYLPQFHYRIHYNNIFVNDLGWILNFMTEFMYFYFMEFLNIARKVFLHLITYMVFYMKVLLKMNQC